MLNDIQKLYDNTLYIHYIHVQHCHILFKDMLFHFSNLFSSILKIIIHLLIWIFLIFMKIFKIL